MKLLKGRSQRPILLRSPSILDGPLHMQPWTLYCNCTVPAGLPFKVQTGRTRANSEDGPDRRYFCSYYLRPHSSLLAVDLHARCQSRAERGGEGGVCVSWSPRWKEMVPPKCGEAEGKIAAADKVTGRTTGRPGPRPGKFRCGWGCGISALLKGLDGTPCFRGRWLRRLKLTPSLAVSFLPLF